MAPTGAGFRPMAIESQRERRAHVLGVTFAGLVGHLNPLMSLCQQLATQDVTVTLAYSQSYYERSRFATINPSSVGASTEEYSNAACSNERIRMVGVRDGLAYQEFPSPDSPFLRCQASIDMEEPLMKLAHSSADHGEPITCLIADVFVLCASSVAQRLGIPYVAFWTQSAACFAAHVVATNDYSSLKAAAGDGTDVGAAGDAVVTCIPGCPVLTFKELPTFLQSCDPAEYFFSYLTECFQSAERCPRILINTFEELESESLHFINKRQNVCAVGPLLPSAGFSNGSVWAAEEECLKWLDRQKPRSVLYVSFGSLALMPDAQLAELAAGLEAAGCPFLMVVREATTDQFPAGFKERLLESGKGLYVAWAPQVRVLGHTSVGGFLTHCGWNSTLEAICKGLPFLCWPRFVDQFLNCRCIVDAWQIGLELKDDEQAASSTDSLGAPLLTRQLIEEKVRYLMDQSSSASIRQRSKQLGMTAAEAVSQDGGSSFLALKSFVAWLYEVSS